MMLLSPTTADPNTAPYTGGNAESAAEGRYRTIFDAAGFAIWEADWSAAYGVALAARAGGVTDLRAWFEARPALLKQLAASARLTDANAAAVKMFGASCRDALLRDGISNYRTPATASSLPRNFANIFDGAGLSETETQFRTASGDVIDVILRVTLPPDHDGWRRALMMAIDVTAWKRDQGRLRQAEADLAHASRISTLGQLASSIAHEVNQPLSAIVTYAESGRRWLVKEAPGAAEVADCLEHVVTNGRRAAEIVSRIRDAARNKRPSFAAVDLGAAVDDSFELLRRELDRHAVRYRKMCPGPSPAVLGDRIQIQQVIINLALNAIQSMGHVPASKRELTVELRLDRGFVHLVFDDTGIGFDETARARPFQPFVTSKPDGMGMGLSICRTILDNHGGSIALENKAGCGARVVVSLPHQGQHASSAA